MDTCVIISDLEFSAVLQASCERGLRHESGGIRRQRHPKGIPGEGPGEHAPRRWGQEAEGRAEPGGTNQPGPSSPGKKIQTWSWESLMCEARGAVSPNTRTCCCWVERDRSWGKLGRTW